MLKKSKKAKIIATRSAIMIICIFFGIMITAQWNSVPDRVTNPIAPYASLKDTKESLYEEQDQLKSEIKKLQKSIAEVQKNSQDITLTKNELENLQYKKAQAGITKLNGPGIIINLNDSKTGVSSEDSIIHAADLRDIINLLWGSGAEAISLNNQRIVSNTAIDCIVNTILVNNVRLSVPFKIEAIGNQNLMSDRLENQNLLSNMYQRKQNNGVVFDITKNNDITVPAYDGSFDVVGGKLN